MNLQQLLNLMESDTTKCIRYCEACALVPNEYDTNKDPRLQYDPSLHTIFTDKVKRPDRVVTNEAGEMTGMVYVSRLAVPIQKKIVITAAAFLGSPSLQANDDSSATADILTAIQDTFDLNKLDYRFRTISKITMSEKACAELWYTVDADDTATEQYPLNNPLRLRMKILARSKGDSLYPVFDEYDNLIAFGRGYKTIDENAKDVQHFDVYTADMSYHSKQDGGDWLWMNPVGLYASDFVGIPNPFGKIPVVYYWQPYTEWHDVQMLIERYENIISNNADTNDYFGNPILMGIGKVLSLPNKTTAGKVLEIENGGDAKYLTWDNGPVSVKQEMEELKGAIYSYTHTPDLSFDKLVNLGYFSTVALKTLFSDAHFKASDKEEIFGEGVQRRINFLKTALSILDPRLKTGLKLAIKPKFTFYIPENTVESVDTITKAVSAGILSTETGVDLNPLVRDAASEMDRIQAEKPPVVENLIPPVPTPAANN